VSTCSTCHTFIVPRVSPAHRWASVVSRCRGVVLWRPPRHTHNTGFWYRIGAAHIAVICAPTEAAARAAILARHLHARGQRRELRPWTRHACPAAASGRVSPGGTLAQADGV
jgi:hypothetical protein